VSETIGSKSVTYLDFVLYDIMYKYTTCILPSLPLGFQLFTHKKYDTDKTPTIL